MVCKVGTPFVSGLIERIQILIICLLGTYLRSTQIEVQVRENNEGLINKLYKIQLNVQGFQNL